MLMWLTASSKRTMWIAMAVWSLAVGTLHGWNLYEERRQMVDTAYAEARANLNKDITFRRWGTSHGGVYVPITENHKSVPWLEHVEGRDVTTTDGRQLTLLNPASMLRQMMDRYAEEYGVRGRITGLRYLNPGNAPDEWERRQLESFERGERKEVWEMADIDGKPFLRHLRAMFMEPGCEKCHAILDYKLGDMRGATGLNLPMAPYYAQFADARFKLGIGYGSVWLLGLVGIGWGGGVLRRREDERNRARQALEANEARFRGIFERSNTSMAFTDTVGNIIEFNDSFLKLLGYEAAEFSGINIARFTHPEDVAAEAVLFKEVLAGTRSDYRMEKRYLTRQGETVWVDLAVTAIRDEQGRVVNFVGLAVDITERKRATLELVAARQAAESANRAKSEFLANMSHEIRTPMNAILGLTQLVLESRLEAGQRDFLQKAHASSRALLGILNDILDYSKIEAGRLDIERRRVDLERLLRDVADLFSAQIEGKGLELLIDIAADVPLWIATDALRLTQVLNNLVGNAVKFTERGEIHIAVGLVTANDAELKLRFVVRDTGIGIARQHSENLFQAFTQADGSVTRKYGGTGLGLAICQRLVSLLGGEIAVSSEEGQGTSFSFTLCAGRVEQAGGGDIQGLAGQRVLVVDDQETARDILDRLLRNWGMSVTTAVSGEAALALLSDAATPPFDAVLLDWRMPGMSGLDLARQLQRDPDSGVTAPLLVMVTAHDREELLAAAVQVRLDGIISKPVTPSALCDALLRRAAAGAADAAVMHAGNSALARRRFDGARVLLVEDNAVNRDVASEFLKRRGVAVTIARHGGEAVEHLRTHDVDLVLMDLHMPVMDGFDAAAAIRQLPNCAGLPIVAMTAAVLEEDRERCAAAGMVDFVAKPVDPDDLARALQRWLPAHLQSAGAAAAPRQTADLPALDGFDFDKVLRRLDGDGELLWRLLCGFRSEQRETAAQFERLLNNGDTAAASAFLHSLKGIAGGIGAERLLAAITASEAELRGTGIAADSPARREFLAALASALAVVAQLDCAAPPRSSTSLAVADALSLRQTLVPLRPYLEERELVPDELLRALQDMSERLAGSIAAVHFARLLRAVDQFDHDGALASLEQVLAVIETEAR